MLAIYFYNDPAKDKGLAERCEQAKKNILEKTKQLPNIIKNLETVISLGKSKDSDMNNTLASVCVQVIFPELFAKNTASAKPLKFT